MPHCQERRIVFRKNSLHFFFRSFFLFHFPLKTYDLNIAKSRLLQTVRSGGYFFLSPHLFVFFFANCQERGIFFLNGGYSRPEYEHLFGAFSWSPSMRALYPEQV
jgi:hypothetical protein